MVHSLDNQAVARAASQAVGAVTHLTSVVASRASMTFVHDMTFVCGQLLKASRGEHEAATDLAAALEKCEVSELSFESPVTLADMLGFVEAVIGGLRDPSRRGTLADASIGRIRLRRVDALVSASRDDADLPTSERFLRLYATGIVVMRDFYETVATGAALLPHRVKRLAHRLVTATNTTSPILLGISALAHEQRDTGARSVQTALLTLLVARQLTRSSTTLSRLALLALVSDAGGVRLDASARDGTVSAAAATVGFAVGGIAGVGAARAVQAFEVGLLANPHEGASYEQRSNVLSSARLVHMVRLFLERHAPADGSEGVSAPHALASLVSLAEVDPLLLELLVRSIGVLPVGTIVELEGGEWAIVSAPPPTGAPADRPRVEIVVDSSGRALPKAHTLDLAVEGAERYRIARVIRPGAVGSSSAGALL